MATRRRARTSDIVEPLDEEQTHDTPEDALSSIDTKEIEKIQAILDNDELAGGSIRLDRKGPGETKWQFCAKFPVDDFSLDYIKQVWGGGDYRASTHRSNGQKFKPFDFSIDYRIRGTMDTPASNQTQGPDPIKMMQALKSMSGDSNQYRMFEQMMHKSDQNTQMMLTMMIESNKTMVGMMTGAFQAMSASQKKDNELVPLLAALSPLFSEMIRNKGTGGTSITELIAAMKDLKDLTGDGPEPEDKSLWEKIIEAASPALVNGLAGGMARQPVRQQLPERTQVNSESPNKNGKSEDRQKSELVEQQYQAQPQPQQATMIQAYVGLLIQAAQNDVDPVTYAELLYNHADEQSINTLKDTLQEDDWFGKIFGSNEHVAQHRSWFEQLRKEILEYEYSEPDASGEGGGESEDNHVGVQSDTPVDVSQSSDGSNSELS